MPYTNIYTYPEGDCYVINMTATVEIYAKSLQEARDRGNDLAGGLNFKSLHKESSTLVEPEWFSSIYNVEFEIIESL